MRHSSLLTLALLAAATVTSRPVVAQSGDTLFTVAKYLDYEQVADPQIAPDGSQIVYTRRFVNQTEDRWDAALWIMNADGSRNRFLARGSNPRWSPDGTRLAYLAEGEPDGTQLFVRYMDAPGAVTQVTRVLESPGDIEWSPDGRWIGFSMFVSKTSTWDIDMPRPPANAHWTAAPKYVTALHYRQDRRGFSRPGLVHLFVVPADGGTPRDVTPGEWSVGARFDALAGGVSWDWSADGRTIFTVGLRDADADVNYRNSGIYAINVTTGDAKQLNAQAGSWDGVAVSPDGRRLAFTGFVATPASYQAEEVWSMNADGTDARRLTNLDRDVGGLLWARDGSGVYVNVAETGTMNVYFVPMSGPAAKVTSGPQMVNLASVSRAGVGAATRSAATSPVDVFRVDLTRRSATGTIGQLTHVNDDLLATVRLGAVERFTTRSGNVEIDGWIVKPPSFDPSRRYPLILEIHGGPHGMYNVGFNPSYQNFAANGFLVLYSNPRGSTGYGSAFGNAIQRDYPGVDYGDLMAAVDAVIAKGFVDTTRMYVGGCSGGGVLSSWVIGHTNRFAAAAVRCPVTDWISMTGHTDIPLFTFQWFEKPFWEDPQPWLAHSPLMYVGNVQTPTLLMTGELDMRTPMPQTEEFYTALKMRGVPAALLRFEGEYHGTSSKPSNWMRTQLYMMSWYNRWPAQATMAGQPTP